MHKALHIEKESKKITIIIQWVDQENYDHLYLMYMILRITLDEILDNHLHA